MYGAVYCACITIIIVHINIRLTSWTVVISQGVVVDDTKDIISWAFVTAVTLPLQR